MVDENDCSSLRTAPKETHWQVRHVLAESSAPADSIEAGKPPASRWPQTAWPLYAEGQGSAIDPIGFAIEAIPDCQCETRD